MNRSFLERNLSRFTTFLQESIFAEETALQNGFLQRLDPRVKTAGFLMLILSSAFSRSLIVIAAIYLFVMILAASSGLFSLHFFRRVWIFMPLYTLLIAFPALFLTPGKPVAGEGPLTVTDSGIKTVLFLILRVATSVSFLLMLVLTTTWPRLLKALRKLGFPKWMTFLLAMTYRYIYVLLSAANSLFLARKSRKMGPEDWRNNADWTGALLTSLLAKSFSMSNDVFLAMQARGYRGEPELIEDFELSKTDIIWATIFLGFAAVSFYSGYWRMR